MKRQSSKFFISRIWMPAICFIFILIFIVTYNKSIFRNGYNTAIACVFNYRPSTLSKSGLTLAVEAASYCASNPPSTNWSGSDRK